MTQKTHELQFDAIAKKAEKLQPWISERRQHLHRNPELSYHEEKTSEYLRAQVESMGLEPSAPVAEGKYGFYTEIKSTKNPDQYILLRADMDALPIVEENDIPFRSEKEGVGHLCGHDAHSSMLLGATSILSEMKDQLPYSVRCVFQHAEEMSPGGAIDFVNAGLTKDVLGCFGIHVSPKLESGRFGLITGEAWAMVGDFDVTITGKGGHGASPHDTIDPVPVAAECIMALQQVVSRRISPVEPAVVSVTMINGGTAFNVIPSSITFGGTLRTYNEERAPEIAEHVHRICKGVAAAHECEVEVRTNWSYPPVVNDAIAIDASRAAITELFGLNGAVEIEKSMGAEDFAYFAKEKPSAFVNLGVRPEGAAYYPLHHPRFLPDESVLWRGSAYLASMAFVAPDYLK